jgi:hypothetical protein
MRTALKYAAIGGVFLMTAGTAAMAQNWNQSETQGSGQRQYQPGVQGGYHFPSQPVAQQELSRYGYNNLSNFQRVQGWSAHATRNGDRVHVMIDDNGMIATYAGP